MYDAESGKIRLRYEQSWNGLAAVRGRSDLLDAIVTRLWNSEIAAAARGESVCAAALGGYGRQALFPYSDVDLLFLSGSGLSDPVRAQAVPQLCRALWDLRLRVSPTVRTLAECGRLYRENLEFNISLLDCRYVCGDRDLFTQLHGRVLPRLVASEAPEMRQRLIDLTRARHGKYGHTIFHLEPNIKDCPGGLRDYQVACWLGLIAALEKTGAWPAPEDLVTDSLRKGCRAGLDFLSAVRCFLHYRQGRDLNGLTYELQSDAATAGVGSQTPAAQTEAEWMRGYFRHVRSIYRLVGLLEEAPPARSGLYRLFENRKSRLSSPDFSVMEGRIFLRQLSSVQDPGTLMDVFEFAARHGLKLSAETERCVEAAVPGLPQWANQTKDLWTHFRRILLAPHAGLALRAMHWLGVLVALFPEFHAIDALVIRDYYHRYTVDEHSLVTLENVHALRRPQNDLERRFLDVLDGIERPDLLFLALLFHDVGKGMTSADHVEGSVAAVGSVVQRLKLDSGDRETVLFLVANHLRMSDTMMRRDIFDAKVVREFSESIRETQPLKMLTLLTYADIKSVNPEALTPWKGEMLWQLHAATFNDLSRNVDDQRLRADLAHEVQIQQIVAASNSNLDAGRMAAFLEGLPRRYLLTHSTEQIVAHCRMHERLHELDPQIEIVRRNGYYDLVLLTLDCPFLFAGVAGTLSSWGMNILKADAYSNKAGTVTDTFRISDRFHTLDLNPGEVERLKRSLADAVSGEVDVAELMRRNFKPAENAPKIKIEPRLHLDNSSSQHSTLIEITAQDRPGLLYDISAALSEFGCNIEVAIIDTQGQTAIDVFYVTCAGTKLDSAHQRKLRAELMQQL